MNTSSRSFRVSETICEELLTRLGADSSDEARVFETEARDLLATLDDWRREVPTSEVRAMVLARVLDLHRSVMEYVTLGHGEAPPT